MFISCHTMEESKRRPELVESQIKTHHSATHSVHDTHGTFTNALPTPRTITVDLHTEEKDSKESDQSDAKYSSKFVILTNASSALVSAGITAGVTLAILLNQCEK